MRAPAPEPSVDPLVTSCAQWCERFVKEDGLWLLGRSIRSLIASVSSSQAITPSLLACWALLFKLARYLIDKGGATLASRDITEQICSDVLMVVTLVTQNAVTAVDGDAGAQKDLWGSNWRSVHASAVSWGLGLLRELLATTPVAFADSLLSATVVSGFATAVITAPEKQDRLAIAAGLARLAKALVTAPGSCALLEELLQQLLQKLRSAELFTAPQNTAQFFKLTRELLKTYFSKSVVIGGGMKLSPTALCHTFSAAIQSHPILELDDADEDIVLQGLLHCAEVVFDAGMEAVVS